MGLQSIKSDDGEVDTELTRRNMQKCIIWTNKPEGGVVSPGSTASLWDQGEAPSHNVSKHLDTIMEERGNSQDTENLRSNLLEVNSKMRYKVKDKITNILALLLQIPAPTKYHYWFALLLDPRYVMELKDIKNFHQSDKCGYQNTCTADDAQVL